MEPLERDLFQDPRIEDREKSIAGAVGAICTKVIGGTFCVTQVLGGGADSFTDTTP